MQSLEEFMRDFLQTRIALAKSEQSTRARYRQKFYTPDCIFDSREGTVEMLESETIIRSSAGDGAGEVVTEVTNPLCPYPPVKHRYCLKQEGGSWRIRDVQVACVQCAGEPGNRTCPVCRGTGWLESSPRNWKWPPDSSGQKN
jgi:hypothetical protein